ncbi:MULTISPECIES: hypothetical protein [Marinobacter]|uniref:Uncharacterized protein n=1 Tax=Marinobacter segnicrescens TaxID=430453 RepID=A0A1I0EL01_9GAMM|nr:MULTISPECIES: hypothetical protein [Marinobacter]UZD65496.1 hypothetical protein LJ360_18280 [Marinobacter sp. AN1]SET46049.1 hypothetical protein SAMN04487962_11030 [Marinobacter segnicrescens]
MNTEKLTQAALKGVDAVGYQLDRMGITDKVNRHNIAAFLMAEQHHLEGEWESLQTRLDRYRRQAGDMLDSLEREGSPVLRPVAERINRFRRNDDNKSQTE